MNLSTTQQEHCSKQVTLEKNNTNDPNKSVMLTVVTAADHSDGLPRRVKTNAEFDPILFDAVCEAAEEQYQRIVYEMKLWRKKKGLTQKCLANLLGTHQTRICGIERLKATETSLMKFLLMGHILGVTLEIRPEGSAQIMADKRKADTKTLSKRASMLLCVQDGEMSDKHKRSTDVSVDAARRSSKRHASSPMAAAIKNKK